MPRLRPSLLLSHPGPLCAPPLPRYANIVHGRFSKAFEQKHFATLSKHTAAMISGLLKPDPQERLGGSRRGTESLRCHPFFWGLNWEALEARELTPPYAELCQNKAKAAKKLFEECERHGACMVLPHSMRPATPSMEGGNSAVNAAAAAMDRMFDFSAW